MDLLEQTIKSIRKSTFEQNMSMAAEKLYPDYNTDRNLKAFTELDYETYYEAR